MRRTDAVLLVLVAVVATASLGAPVAHASPSVDRQAWARTGPAAPPSPHDGNLYVAAAGGDEQARAFLHVDVAGLTTEQVAAAQLTVVPASDGIVTDQTALIACVLTSPFTASGELGAPPAADCSVRADVVRGTAGTWTVPLSVFADAWSAGANDGLALVPSADVGAGVFSVSLDAAKTSLSVPMTTAASPRPTIAPTSPTEASVAPTTMTAAPPPEAIAPSPEPLVAPERPRPPPATVAVDGPPVGRRAAHPSFLLVLVPVLLVGAALLARSRSSSTGSAAPRRAGTTMKLAGWVVTGIVLTTLGETTIYKLGLIAVAFIAAIGLHLLVNWTGELSLAHAGFIGVPAFVVVQFSSHSGLSPILGLPIAVLAGVVLGALVGVAALRSRGLQVALVTLAVGIAVGQFLFFRTWLVGPVGGLRMPVPSLFGVELQTSRSLVPVVGLAVLLAAAAARSIMHSKIGRALLLVRSDPDAAAAAGVAVARHRALAYAFAGGFAGLAGWSYVVWVQQVSAKAFPLQLGFTYLVIAALAGPGGLAGVLVAAVVIEGGALFSILPHSVALYLAPIALIVNVTRYQEGFNGVLRVTRATLRRRGATMTTKQAPELRPLAVLGTLAVVAGFAAISMAWYHMGNTDAVWVQNQELISGGVFGLGLIIVGAVLLLRDALLASRTFAPAPPSTAEVAVTASNGARQRRSVPIAAGE